MKAKLTTFAEAEMLIRIGKTLLIAGDESLLRALPRGNWIGGTIPYFMAAEGGIVTKEQVFINELPLCVTAMRIREYDESTINQVYVNIPENGFSFIIIPGLSPLHFSFALSTSKYPDFRKKPLGGWISGVHLKDVGKEHPKVVNGLTGEVLGDKAIAMEVELPPNYVCELNVVNIFHPGDGETFQFLESGFSVTDVMVGGKKVNFSEYLLKNGINTKLPLIAISGDFNENVSFQTIDPKSRTVSFYAPVFEGVEYKLAKEINNYSERFSESIPPDDGDILFSANCILNFIYSDLEDHKKSGIVAPITFGEIAYKLLNQSLVSISIRKLY